VRRWLHLQGTSFFYHSRRLVCHVRLDVPQTFCWNVSD
jgi:hypothetical protein